MILESKVTKIQITFVFSSTSKVKLFKYLLVIGIEDSRLAKCDKILHSLVY